MAQARGADPMRGKTLQWTFTDGPAKGTTFEHQFREDGTVEFHAVDKPSNGKSEHPKGQAESTAHYGAAKIADDVCAISYKGESGYTLTTVLNFKNKQMVGYASNDKDWFEQQGTFEEVSS